MSLFAPDRICFSTNMISYLKHICLPFVGDKEGNTFVAGPVYMVSVTRDSPRPETTLPSVRDNFTKRLYENCVTETQLTLLNYAYTLNIIICPYFFVVRPLLSIAAFSHSENGPIHLN